MRFPKSRILTVVSGALLAAAAATAAFADDTEIFFNQNTADIPANVLFIMDTSGSMNDQVTTQFPYDPSKTYTADKCGASTFDANSFYYSSKGLPKCGSANKIDKGLFKCKSMLTQMANAGYATDTFAQWGSANASKTTGKGTPGNPTVVVNTTTYGWQKTVSSANTTGYVECKADAGVDGDGVDNTKLFATTDTFSLQTTTTTPPGTTVVNADSISGFPQRQTGIWDPAKNFFSNFGAAGGTATTCVGPCTIYTLNYLNYLYDSSQINTSTKMSIMHDAMASLLTSMTGVNVGLARYDYRGSGGMILAPIAPVDTGTNRTNDINLVKSWAPAGVTPLSGTYYEAYRYFSGNGVVYGNASVSTTCTSWNAANGTCGSLTSFAAPSVAGTRTGGTLASNTYDSPADYSCRQNFIVYLTDGLPNETVGQAATNAAIQKLNPKKPCDPLPPPGGVGGQCLATLADYMYNNDMRPDISKVQNVTSYFIGFGADFSSGGAPTSAFNYLQAAATAGGGQAYTATDLTELTSAFNDILATVIKTNTTFAAPAVTVNAFNRTQTLDNLYVSVFAPSANYHWPGNIKKYKFQNGKVVDSLGNPAVSPATGFFTDTAKSYWSGATVDGSDVTLGGAASNLPDFSVRKVLTYTGSTYPAALVALTPTSVTDTDLNLIAGDPPRAEVVSWALGQDTGDDVPPSGTADTRHQMGDPIHTQPVAIVYGKKADGTDDTVVFAPTNDGYFHAIDASASTTGTDTATSGAELWAFVPKEMLPHIKDLYANAPANTKHYGLDGSIAVLKYDINGDGTISGSDRVILFFGTGRNADTSAYYALDVTDRNNPQLLWKDDGSVLPGLGQAWSTPIITRINISGATQNSQRLVLVMGGGYDAMEDNSTWYAADTVGNHIYMVDAISGKLLWSAGKTAGNFINASMTHAIPSPVAVIDVNGNGYADRMYVGDMAAQVWRFDITNGATVGNLVAGGVIASLGTKLSATHPAADQRRFYSAPDVAAEQKPKLTPFLSIAIGSGYRGHPLDQTIHDRFYDIRDYNGFQPLTQAQFNGLAVIRDALSGASPALVDITAIAAPTLPPATPGWQLNLNSHPDWTVGEKSLAPSRTFGDQIIFTTYTPNTNVPTDPCSGVGTGTNRAYAVDVFDGSPMFDRNNDNVLTTDERSQDLRQSGIAPETAFLFPAPPPGAGGGPGNGVGGNGSVTCLTGVEVLNVCKKFDQRVKTYWREGMAN
jgi:type IV pilus assembly protein PilY1